MDMTESLSTTITQTLEKYGGLVAKSCPTLLDCMDYSLLDSSVHGISQAGILGWVAIFYSRDLPDQLYH